MRRLREKGRQGKKEEKKPTLAIPVQLILLVLLGLKVVVVGILARVLLAIQANDQNRKQ